MSSGASPELQAVAEAIFQVVLESSLGEARQGAADDEEEGEAAAEAGPDGDNTIHESFSRTAMFGRCCLPQAIAILGGLLQERINRATTSAVMGTTPSLPVNFWHGTLQPSTLGPRQTPQSCSTLWHIYCLACLHLPAPVGSSDRRHAQLVLKAGNGFLTVCLCSGASGESPSGTVDVAVTLEEICWLVEMAAHLLADSGDGEVPQLPAAVAAAIQLPESEQALLQLSQLILAVPNFCIDSKLKHLASPRQSISYQPFCFSGLPSYITQMCPPPSPPLIVIA